MSEKSELQQQLLEAQDSPSVTAAILKALETASDAEPEPEPA